ncbi:MAG: SDR family NAD(P)-dependent oxidoreductase [Kiritimatiellales bacterium]
MNAAQVKEKTVLVTGCSSGIGLAAARLLKKSGWNVIPTVRSETDLAMLRAKGFEPVQLDVASSESVNAAADEVLRRFNGQLGAIVNNAGFGLASAVEDMSRDMLRDLFEVHVCGMQELTNRFIPVFRRQGYGRIVNLSSVLGEISLPFAGGYSAAKFAVEALSDALRRELAGSGIGVSIIQPGPIDSQFSVNLAHRMDRYTRNENSVFASFYKEALETRKAGKAHRTAGTFMKPPEAVAREIRRCLERRNPPRRVRITAVACFGAAARRFFPAALLDMMMVWRLKKKLTVNDTEKTDHLPSRK